MNILQIKNYDEYVTNIIGRLIIWITLVSEKSHKNFFVKYLILKVGKRVRQERRIIRKKRDSKIQSEKTSIRGSDGCIMRRAFCIASEFHSFNKIEDDRKKHFGKKIG